VVNFAGPRELLGRLAKVEITEAHPHSLKGTRVEDPTLSSSPADDPQAPQRRVSC
jgi:hypothetical protein